MADKKYYLDQPGLERLVDYINNSLNNKANVGDVPANVVVQSDLENYALKSEIPAEMDLSGYATKQELEDYATETALQDLENRVTGVYHFRGSVADLDALTAIENPAEGDVYNIEDTGMNAAWTGSAWDEFGTIVDLTPYALEENINALTIPQVDAILYGGKSAVVNDMDGLNAMLANSNAEVNVTLNSDLAATSMVEVPAGKKLHLDLGGNSLSSSGLALYVNGGEAVISNGNVASSSNDAITVRNGGTLILDGANVTSTSRNAISAREGAIIVNSGSVTSQEAGLLGFKDSVITINGGTITGIDNGPVMGNGSAAGSANDGTNMNVVMNGGTLIAHIQSAGYTACGVYVPNSGSFTMNGGEIISDGCGICQRGGTVNLNGGRIVANGAAGAVGKVGDSRVVVGSYAVVYDANSKYPAMDTLELNIADGMVLNGTDGDIQILLADGVEANINDNRS